MTHVVTLVEIDVDHCSLTYSVPPCQATLTGSPPTGTRKCFNSLGTCQDPENFTNVPVTYRFCEDVGILPQGVFAFPFVQEIDTSPGILSLGEDMGQRTTVTVRFRDARHSDAGPDFDKYLDERPYDPFSQGTFWGKFRARNPFLRGRPLRLLWGDSLSTLETFETRLFVIESFNGPDVDGVFEIVAKDVLVSATGDRAQAPRLSEGTLQDAMTASQTFLNLTNGTGAEYTVVGLANLTGNEIVSYTANHRYLVAYIDFEAGGPGGVDGEDSQSNILDAGAISLTQDWLFVGNATDTTTQSAVGSGSMALDGTGDYLKQDQSATAEHLAFGSNDFNIEFYVRLTSLGAQRTLYDSRPSGVGGAYPTIRVSAANVLLYFTNSAIQITGTTALQLNTWHRVRLSRLSGSTRLFLDHVQEGSTYADATVYLNPTDRPIFGANGNSLGTESVPGFLDHLIVENGIGYATDPVATARTDILGIDFEAGDGWNITRAQEGTTATTHAALDRVQQVLEYSGDDPAEIIRDLLVTYAGVDSDLIPLESWLTETDTFLGAQYTAVIAEPTAVSKLIGELIEQAALALWWDEVDQQVRLQVLRPVPSSAERLSEENILSQTLEIHEQPDKRISQVWTYYGQKDRTKPVDELDNYRSNVVTADLDAEADYGSPMIKKIVSRWIPALGGTIAELVNDIQLSMYRDPPRRFNFEVMRRDETDVRMGGGYQLSHWSLQNDIGELVDVPVQVTRVEARTDRLLVEAEEMLLEEIDFGSPPTRHVVLNTSTNNFNFRDAYDLLYATPVSGDVAICRVSTGVTIGSTSTGSPAFDVGDWPAGVTVHVIVQAGARIQGKGGRGGNGREQGFGGTGGFINGGQGGTALYTRQAITLTLDSATGSEIFGGGGGGGGGGAGSESNEDGGGGGGGAGTLGGTGGSAEGGASFGANGTSEAGGIGGTGVTITAPSAGTGGAGGGPGLSGSNGATAANAGGTGGAAGRAVDGHSFVTYVGTGDIRGSQVN